MTLSVARSLARSQTYQSAADAPATLRAYKTDLENFKAWCMERKLTPMPAAPEIVGAYLADAGRGYALSTLRRRVAAIARAHRIAKEPLDTRHPAIRETLRGIARTHGEPPRRAAALTTADIKRLVAACGDDMAGTRDQAIFLICFAGALRRSELVGLDIENVTKTTEGLRLLITRSKTDKEGAGAEIGLSYGRHPATCPVAAFTRWTERAGIQSGPLFRKVDRWGVVHIGRLDPDAVRQILKKRAALAGMKGTIWEPITPHGMRAGFVTTAYKNGVPDEEIMGHTRHRSLTTMRTYVRRAKLNTDSPAGKLGL
ncbi:site-specific integrase [Acidisphaera sp. L21]|uniref:site-specific integrase n=1 Tax=Acidisphaera sp. L21 TaxID=1641851 RepID=UPI00131B03F2|nr:site-specific integrase [Acidisphaera sp. L21]